jgi:N-dimethylarginine dimethylaminohydrolase
MLSEDLSEHCVKPQMIIVHDPTPFTAFDDFLTIEDEEAFFSASLFREKPDIQKLHRQHADFVEVLKEHVPVMYLSEILGNSSVPIFEHDLQTNPNHIYTHDAIITIPWVPEGYILGNMKKPIRRDEPIVLAKVAEILGYKEILKIPSDLYLEGGDVMPFCHEGRRVLLMGYGPRTAEKTLFYLQQTLVQDGIIDDIIGLRLAAWRLNIDGCFFPVSEDTIVSHPGSIQGGIRLGRGFMSKLDPISYFKALGFEIIEATVEESYFQQACNFVCLGARKLVAYNMTKRINEALRGKSFEVIGIEGDEMVKGNGGPHCMTRPFYRA